MKTTKGAIAPEVAMTVVAGAKTEMDDAFFQIQTKSPIDTYDILKNLRIVKDGDFSGVCVASTAKFKTEQMWIETRARSWEPAGRDITDSWVPAHYAEAEGYYKDVQAYDGQKHHTVITTSKRADIRQDAEKLFLAQETIDLPILEQTFESQLKTKPVEAILKSVLGEETTNSLTESFNAVKKIEPLSVKEALDHNIVSVFQAEYARAVAAVNDNIERSGITNFLGEDNVAALVKRACGLDLKAA